MITPAQYSKAVGSSRRIEGVKTQTLRVIPDDRGWLMEILRADDPDLFQRFGQVYVCNISGGRQSMALPQAPDRQFRLRERDGQLRVN